VTAELTSSVRAAGPILQVLAEGGADLGQVGARLGIDLAVFADQDARIPISKLIPLWDVAEELLDDPFVGLHVAQRASRETFDIFSYIACASANLDEVRRELATRYLTKERDLSVSEVAYMLGFSETAPFFRAFKKWTGQTPGEFRKAKAAL
jgi:hypothetical protein